MKPRIDKLAMLKTLLWACTIGLYGFFCPGLMIEIERDRTRR